MSDPEKKSRVHSVESDEDYYFEINITRSQLSDIICRNEDCEAAQKFAQRGIGPLVPAELKDPYECYEYYPPPEKKPTNDASTQSPRKFPCGSPNCKYLNVFPDGQVCDENVCKFKKSICDDPKCDMKKYTVQAVCGLCGGYSISGQTCENFDCSDRSFPKPIEYQISSTTDLPPSIKPCNDECSKPPEMNKKKTLKPPVSILPFDQLQAAARKERLVTLVGVFEEVIGRLQELVMYVMECHFDIFNPHISKTTGHRGQVWANNKFYMFYVNSSTIILNLISELLKDIWNQSVRTKSATIPKPLQISNDFPKILIPPCQRASQDVANFIVNNLGMKASYNHLENYILTIFQTAVTSNKKIIPPLEIPNSPIVSKENIVILQKDKFSNQQVHGKVLYKLRPENFHLPVRYGHLYCIPPNQSGKMVPKNMGWLWNLGEKFGRLEPLRYYRPGAVSRVVAEMIKMHKGKVSGAKAVKKAAAKKKKTVEVSHVDVAAMLSVIKREGHYMIKMIPTNNPWSEENKDYSPLIFVISNKRDRIYRVNPDGTEEVVLECDCNSETSSISEGEFEINYTPPVLMVEKPDVKSTLTKITQYNLEDILPPPTKFKKLSPGVKE